MADRDRRGSHPLARPQRLFAAIAALTMVAVAIVGLTFAFTEAERVDLQGDTQTASTLHALSSQLSAATREEQAAVDEYLLAADPAPDLAFDQAVQTEATTAATMTQQAADYPALQAAIRDVTTASAAWQATYARPAIAAVQAGGGSLIAPFTRSSAADHAATDAAIGTLSTQLGIVDGALLQREDTLTIERSAATIAAVAFLVVSTLAGLLLVRRYGRTLQLDALNAGILNRFTEVTSFAADDTDVAKANLEALALLVHPDAAVTHVLNRSKDRAVPEAEVGDAVAEVLPLNALSRCPGVVRGGMYVTDDAAAALSVHCPVYPVDHGTLACVALNSGEAVGAVHLYWEHANALPLDLRASVARIAEHAALAIGNRRLLAALQGQANTDPRTGLANSRAFDLALEEALTTRTRDEQLAVLMIDLDHFKDFNDQHGHPGGDEALRAFAGVLRSCMRDGDVAARYGGEEFAILLPSVDATTALAIADRIRTRTESSIIALAPGMTARITISLGVASAPAQGLDRVTLLHVADEALYHAKAAGRNRVAYLGGETAAATAPSNGRSRAVPARAARHA